MRPTDTVFEEEVFLHLFSGATDGQSFVRRSFFCLNIFSGATDGAVRPMDTVLEEEGFFAFI